MHDNIDEGNVCVHMYSEKRDSLASMERDSLASM
jgi:hypothetical protein